MKNRILLLSKEFQENTGCEWDKKLKSLFKLWQDDTFTFICYYLCLKQRIKPENTQQQNKKQEEPDKNKCTLCHIMSNSNLMTKS